MSGETHFALNCYFPWHSRQLKPRDDSPRLHQNQMHLKCNCTEWEALCVPSRHHCIISPLLTIIQTYYVEAYQGMCHYCVQCKYTGGCICLNGCGTKWRALAICPFSKSHGNNYRVFRRTINVMLLCLVLLRIGAHLGILCPQDVSCINGYLNI